MNKVSDNIKIHNIHIDREIKCALSRISSAVNNREKIIIYGHYDLDCVTGVSLLILILRYLNADVEYYIPSEIDDDYEIDRSIVDSHIKLLGATLMITVGCGINSYDEVEYCKKMGIDVIITDFKKASGIIPNTYVLNYTQYEEYNSTAVGVAFKLAKEIANYYKINCVHKYMDLVMLGTVSRDVAIAGENKDFIIEGIKRLKVTNNYGLKALMKVHKIFKIDINTIYKLVTTAIPTVNPVGKMDNARIVVELFTTSNSYRAEQIAKYLKRQVENVDESCIEYKNEIHKLRTFSKDLQLF
ncbi:DHH family phosphoesterase [Clostridium sp. KNHs214]|uniref:DHH family phosphoesterase n=1 Tax=Clostridium sp. KNHs214 TaxID=1540257 RepID=UPI00068A90B5|nr:DHH family phosphoesterase [Clostridium sp. KNHs214]